MGAEPKKKEQVWGLAVVSPGDLVRDLPIPNSPNSRSVGVSATAKCVACAAARSLVSKLFTGRQSLMCGGLYMADLHLSPFRG